MNHNLQKEVGIWIDALIKWRPDMCITGIADFCQNIAKLQFIEVYKKTILELRANRYDGLANTLETRFEVLQKDVTEREKKRYANDDDQPVFDQLLSDLKITKPASARSSDIYLAVTHIALSKQHLIDVLKTIAQLPEDISSTAAQETPAGTNGGQANKLSKEAKVVALEQKKRKGRPPVDVQPILDFIDNNNNHTELCKNKKRIWAFLAKKFNYSPDSKEPNRALQSLFTQTYPKYYKSIQGLK